MGFVAYFGQFLVHLASVRRFLREPYIRLSIQPVIPVKFSNKADGPGGGRDCSSDKEVWWKRAFRLTPPPNHCYVHVFLSFREKGEVLFDDCS